MEKKEMGGLFVLNIVKLGERVTGIEFLNKGVNGNEIMGLTEKMVKDAIQGGQTIYGMKVNEAGELVLAPEQGFKSVMTKVGISTLTSSDPEAVANIIYTVYDRDGEGFKVVSSRFGHMTFTLEKVKALMELGAVNGLVEKDGQLVGCWELKEDTQAQAKGKETEQAPEGEAKKK